MKTRKRELSEALTFVTPSLPRYLRHGPVLHNYGCLPQTWEDPSVRQTPENLPGAAAWPLGTPCVGCELTVAVRATNCDLGRRRQRPDRRR